MENDTRQLRCLRLFRLTVRAHLSVHQLDLVEADADVERTRGPDKHPLRNAIHRQPKIQRLHVVLQARRIRLPKRRHHLWLSHSHSQIIHAFGGHSAPGKSEHDQSEERHGETLGTGWDHTGGIAPRQPPKQA